MQDKMERLLNQIGMNKDYLENASIDKIIVYEKNNLWEFIISNDKVLPVYIYDELCNKIMNTFKTIKDINVVITTNNNSNEYLEDYFDKLIDLFSDESIKYKTFIDRKLNIDNDNYIFDVYNKAELAYMTEKKEYLNEMLNRYGFNGNFVLNLCENKGNDILNQIENDKIVNIPSMVSPIKESVPDKVEEKKYFRPKRDTSITPIKDLMYEVDNITINGMIFGMDMFESKSGYKIITLKVTDNSDSIYVKMFTKDNDEYARIKDLLKVGSWYNFYGKVAMDKYSNELTFTTRYKDVDKTESPEKEKVVDNAPVKRVELHAHTMMSQMDGITNVDLNKHTCELVSKCIDMGYRGVAITDHSGCQAFPIAYDIIKSYNKKIEDPSKHFKGLYGTELTVVDDTVNIVVRPDDRILKDLTYVVFDTETTGFNAGGADQMIEIGAVKIKDGAIIDRFDELIDPGRHIPDKITELTCITDDMVKGKDNEENVTKRFLEWAGDNPMVAHNAKFDISFISSAMKKYNLGEFNSTVIDTLELSRALDTGYSRHSLSALVKRYNVPWDEDAHHRADYDAEGTALVFYKMLGKLFTQNFEKISDLEKLIPKDEIYKFGRTYHFNAIALNKTGLKNLFKIISLANTTYLYKTPRILRSKLNELREGLIIGSGCYESEVFIEGRSKEGEELTNIINFYDYVEVQPPEVYDHLIQTSDFKDVNEIKEHIKKIINATREAGKLIVATGDVHHFSKEDKIYREIIVNQKVPGGGRHPLAKSSIKSIPSQHFRTTEEMLNDFAFLGEELAYDIVVTNTNKVLDMVDEIEVIIDTGGIPFSPRVKSDDGKSYLDCPRVVTDLVFDRAKEWYGDDLPHNIEERISKELYGDIVYKCWKEIISEDNPNISDDELDSKLFENLHNTLVNGFDEVKMLVSDYVKKHWSEEDGEMTKDPHIWFSVNNWKAAANEVAKGFASKDPENKEYYESNLKAYLVKLDELDKKIKEEVNAVAPQSRVLVTAHDAFAYFARDYGFEVKGIQGISTASEAGTSDISNLAAFIADNKIKAIFVESSVPHKTIESLQAAVKAHGFDVSIGGELYSDSLGDADTNEGTYIGMYEHNIKTITGDVKEAVKIFQSITQNDKAAMFNTHGNLDENLVMEQFEKIRERYNRPTTVISIKDSKEVTANDDTEDIPYLEAEEV